MSRSPEAGMIRAELRLHLPEGIWIGDVSSQFPRATFRLLSGAPMDDRSLELGEVRAGDPAAAVERLRDHSAIVTFDLLYADDERALTRYETTEQGLFDFLGAFSISPEFPLSVRDGVMTFAVTATQSQFDALGDTLDTSGLQYELRSVVHSDDHSTVLTDRQQTCLAVARRLGYFEVPRNCTLEDVATELDVDKSTASETLRRGTARVLAWFFVGDS